MGEFIATDPNAGLGCNSKRKEMVIIMKKIILKYKFTALILFMFALLVPLCAVLPGNAATEDFDVTVKYDPSVIYEYNGGLYLSSSTSKNASMRYTITNNMFETVRFSAVRITETLCGESNHYGNTTYDTGIITILPGGSYELEGDSLEFDSATDFVFQYNIFAVYYSEDEYGNQKEYTESDFVQILENDEFMYITRESISLDATYDYWMMQENIYAGDMVTVEFSITSSSNVPVRNVMVYDTVYGYIGKIDEIAPGETKDILSEITVNESTSSYVHITYITDPSLDGSQTPFKKDFPENSINIDVTYHSYFLGMEVKCNDEYIGKGQTVNLEFIVTNVGSGRIENIVVLNEANVKLFTIDALEPGDIYTQTIETICNPNTTYKFNCISPQTEAVEAQISFSSLPGIILSYKLDKAVDEYKYRDMVIVVYTVTNNGSIDAKNLILTDSGINQTWDIGELAKGEQKSITFTYEISTAHTRFEPELSGDYVDYAGEQINEICEPTEITVELPEKFADIDITYTHTPEIIYAGDSVNFSFELLNKGDCALMTYSVLIVEENMIIASEGKLDAGESKIFNAMILCNENRKFTVKVEGRNQNTGTVYSKSYRVSVEVLPRVIVTPTPGPSGDVEPTPTPKGGNIQENNKTMFTVVMICAGIALIMLIITGVVLGKGVAKKIKARRNNQ